MTDADVTEELALYIADTTLAAGLQYGLWVERSPSTEEQVALSSMSQDKLGHARAFLSVAEKATGRDAVELQYDRAPDAFRWNPAWTIRFGTWNHLILAQVCFARALTEELEALAEGSALAEPLDKIAQEERWHTQHGDAWLERAAASDLDGLQAALEDLWPFVVGFFGSREDERFADELDAGLRTRSDAELLDRTLDTLVPQLEEVGLDVDAERADDGWSVEPEPTAELVDDLRERTREDRIELVGLLQDPEGRELAELA